MKVVRFKMVAHRVNMRYSARETVKLVLNEGSDLEDFLDSGSEENIVDSGDEFVPVDLVADSRDSDNNIFIFITGISATRRLKLYFSTVFGQFQLCCCDRKVYDMMLWIIYLTSTHPKLSKNVLYMFIVLFLVVHLRQFFLNRQKQCVCRSQAHHFVAS